MLYKQIFFFITMLLVISGCTKNNASLQKETKIDIQEVQKTIEKSHAVPDISGNYALVKGSYIYNNGSLALQNKIESSTMVIEKLDQNNFGYYYVTQVEGLNIEGYFGGFTYKDGQFFQKVIDYPNTNTLLYDNITLVPKNHALKLTVKTINAKRVIQWNKIDDVNESDPTILSALEEEKKAYLELFKEKLFPREHISMNID